LIEKAGYLHHTFILVHMECDEWFEEVPIIDCWEQVTTIEAIASLVPISEIFGSRTKKWMRTSTAH